MFEIKSSSNICEPYNSIGKECVQVMIAHKLTIEEVERVIDNINLLIKSECFINLG